MSRRRNYHSETIEVMERFFIALDELRESGKLDGGINGFCTKHGIDKRHLYQQRADLGRGFFEVYWLITLIKDYRVSQNWLLLGAGKMFS